MKKLRKIFMITGISLLSLLALAIVLPIIFKPQIVAKIKREINSNLNAVVEFSDVDISLLRRFPRLSVRLENISVAGKDEFAKDTLISAKSVDAAMNILSLFDNEQKIYAVDFNSPRIHALVNKEGKANWDITKASETTTTSTDTAASSFKMQLSSYSIHDGYIMYKDESSDMSAEISGLDHEGSGELTADVFTLSTNTKSKSASFTYEGIPYLLNTNADIQSDILIDNKNSKYSFNNCDLLVNNLKLKAEGFFQLVDDSTYKMDINLKSPSTDFKDLLSLVPAIYKTDFDKIKADGKASFGGFVKGVYSPTQMPAYDIDLDVADASFQYPDLPKPVKNISFHLKASNPDGLPDNAVVDISKGHIEMDNEPVDFHLLYKNPETIQYIDAAAKGKIDLSEVSKFVKLDAGTKLAGVVLADVFAKGNMQAMQTQEGDFTAGGLIDIRDLYYASKDFPQPIQHANMKIDIVNNGGVADNTSIEIGEAHMEIGNDPVDFTLNLKRPMSSVDFNGTAKGKFTLDHIKQFMTLDSGTSISGLLNADLKFSGSKAMIDKAAYDDVNLSGTASLNNVKYVSKDYPAGMQISSSELSFNPGAISLNKFNGSYLQSNFSADGVLSNFLGYALKNETLNGNINMSVDKLNLADWMGSTTSTTTEPASSAPFAVPAKMDITIHAKADQVKYDKVDYNNINGTLKLSDETVQLQNVSTDALDGTIIFNGSYSTLADKMQPAISLNYNVKDIDIQKAFYAFNTVQKLMPVGQYLAGKLSSQLTMKGKLNGDLMPDLNSLSGNGNLLLLEGVMKKFAPLDKIASSLNVAELNEISLKDVKSYIEFSNGKVLVKPFTVKIRDIEMQLGGMHGFDQSIDYIVQLKMPRKYLGTNGNNLVNNLVSKANAKGVAVKMGETVNLNIKLGGTITNPTMQTELKEVAGDAVKELQQQATDFAKQKVDSAKTTIKDSAIAIKKEVTNELKKELQNQLLGNKDSANKTNLDSTKKKAVETAKNTLKGLFGKKKKTED